MKKAVVGITLGLLFCGAVFSWAKYESGSRDAASSVMYGNTGSAITPVAVDASGKIQLNMTAMSSDITTTGNVTGAALVANGNSTPGGIVNQGLNVYGPTNSTGFLFRGLSNTSVDRVTILDNGNVGIGTTAPITTLDVSGITSGVSIGGTVMPATTLLRVGTHPTQGLTVKANGNVGIGITAPGASLDIAGDMITDDINTDGILLNTGGSLVSGDDDWFMYSDGSYNSLRLRIGNKGGAGSGTALDCFTIGDDGEVGIGNTNPSARLVVQCADTTPANSLYLRGPAGARQIYSQPDGGCSSCGVNATGEGWSCIDVTCP